MADPNQVRWELTSDDRGYRLTVHHAFGLIVESFDTAFAAVAREHELEALLQTARGLRPPRCH